MIKKIFIKFTRFMTKSNRVFRFWKDIGWNKPTLRQFISNISHTKKIVTINLCSSKTKGKLVVSKPRGFNINSFFIPQKVKWLFGFKSFINSFRTNKKINRFFLCFHSFINTSFSVFTSSFRFTRTLIFLRKNNKSISRFISVFIFKKFISFFNGYPFRVTFFTEPVPSMRARFSSAFEALFMFDRPHTYIISMTGQYGK